MSRSWLDAHFTSGDRDGTGIIQNDLAAVDLFCHKVAELLNADATLTAMFTGGRIEVVEAIDFENLGLIPRIEVSPTTMVAVQAPTQVRLTELPVFVRVLTSIDRAEVVPQWAPSNATLTRHIMDILAANRQMADQSNSINIQLCRNSDPNPVSYTLIPSPDGIRLISEIEWLYRVEIDDITGKLLPIHLAGGS